MPHAIPSRFRPNPDKQGEAWRFRLLLGKKGLPTAGQMDHYRELLMQGDPLDDQLADWAQAVGFMQARALLDKALDEGIATVPEAPDFLKDLFGHIDAEPMWLDRQLLELGQRAICRTGVVGTLVMRDAALMGGYGNAAINKPLVFTGALADGAARRTSETRAFAIDATRPGAMNRFGKGFRTTVRVRFLHAILRRRIRSHPDWRDEDWGIPINQGDMLATNLAFSVAYLTGMRVLGFRYSRRERDGVIHLWRYIGYLMGIDERILVTDEKEGLRILYTVLISQPEADADTRKLALALMNEPYETAGKGRLAQLWAEAQVRAHNGVSHFFLGGRSYRNLGLPEGRRWTWVPLAIMPAVAAAETVRQLTPFGNELFARVGLAWRERWIRGLLQHRPAAYQPVSVLARDRDKTGDDAGDDAGKGRAA
jgi:hypothetical protein